jgi:hypothetical protein
MAKKKAIGVDLQKEADKRGITLDQLVVELANGPPIEPVYAQNTREKARVAPFKVELKPVPLTLDEMASQDNVGRVGKKGPGNAKKSVFDVNWDKIVQCCYRGWTYKAICMSLGVSPMALVMYFKRHPDRKKILDNARMRLQSDMVDVLVASAKSGRSNSWLPACWLLERLFWTQFAKPEVKVQLMQMEQNTNETVQTFGGKTLEQLAREMRTLHAGNPHFEQAVESLKKESKRIEADGIPVDDTLLGDTEVVGESEGGNDV